MFQQEPCLRGPRAWVAALTVAAALGVMPVQAASDCDSNSNDILDIGSSGGSDCAAPDAASTGDGHSQPAAASHEQAVAAPGAKARPAHSAAGAPESAFKEYLIGADDVLEIEVFQVPDLVRTVRVNARGEISFPLIGRVQAGGLTTQALEDYLALKLGEKYLQDPQVSVFVKEYANRDQITVEGYVSRPGIIPLRGNTSLLQVMAVVGGPNDMANVDRVTIYRTAPDGQRKSLDFDVAAIREGKAPDPRVEANDLVEVHEHKGKAALKSFRTIFSFGLLR